MKMQIFLWDDLVEKRIQNILGVELKFISNAYANAYVYKYRWNPTPHSYMKKKYDMYFLVTPEMKNRFGTRTKGKKLFGNLYEVKFNDLVKLCRYAGSSQLNQGKSYYEDPVRLEYIEVHKWKEDDAKYDLVQDALCFVANRNNKQIKDRFIKNDYNYLVRGSKLAMNSNIKIKS